MIGAREFERLAAAGATHVPVVMTMPADCETPVGVYLKLANAPYSYLLESAAGGARWSRYSIIGLGCDSCITVRDRAVELRRGGELEERLRAPDPLAWIAARLARVRAARPDGDMPSLVGGLVGYFSYETARYGEPRLDRLPRATDGLDTPDILLLESQEVAVFDNLLQRLYLITHADVAERGAHARACRRLEDLASALDRPAPRPPSAGQAVAPGDFSSDFGEDAFKDAVGRVKRHIVAGDIMQLVLSQRLSAPFAAHPFSLYRALRQVNPSPYMYYFDMADFHIVGASPESMVRMDDGLLSVRPIAGTRPRGADAEEDRRLADSLLADEKELAEHLMLIDLGRNDLGRVCSIGSVRLTERMRVEYYSHVMHIVSNVVGRPRPDVDRMDVLRATLPAGTVSGAPKIRAMELIAGLEAAPRGVYSGAVGYLSWSGAMDTAIAIRTAVVKDGRLHVQAGAGLVHDSVPAREWEETMNKARAVMRAATMAAELH